MTQAGAREEQRGGSERWGGWGGGAIGEARGGGGKALESWREPWVGNDPELSRSTTAGDTEAECRASPNMEYW